MRRLFTKRGDARRFGMQVTTTDPTTGITAPVDLTSAAIALVFTAKERLTDLDAAKVFQKTRAAGGIVVTDPLNGWIEVRLIPADTAGAAPRTLYWDLQLTSASEPVTLDDGYLYIQPDVTIAP